MKDAWTQEAVGIIIVAMSRWLPSLRPMNILVLISFFSLLVCARLSAVHRFLFTNVYYRLYKIFVLF